jgi:NAD(P)H-dependent FMN reductase
MTKIAVIVGSNRPGRFGIQVGKWLVDYAAGKTDVAYELVDISDYNLPVLDEEVPSGASKEHTKAWAAAIAQYDGFVYVTAEYNHSVPGNFKNAVDYLNAEWQYKPVGYVSYGWAKGHRAVEAWRSIAAQFNQFDIREEVNIQLDGSNVFNPSDFEASQADALINALSFWSAEFQQSRAKLAN